MSVRAPEWEQTHAYIACCLCLSVYFCSVCVLACVCLVSLRKGSHRVNRVEINKDKSSIFSLSDRWFTQKQLRSVIEQPQEMQQTKTMSHSSELQSCLKFYSHAIMEWCQRSYILFTIYFDISYFDLLFHIHSVPHSFRLHGSGNKKALDFGFKMILWYFLSPQKGQE